ncbi:MAG: pyruvate decarboxylase [Monoraphidium minutum]|nr:MAG: pyruvate decarboxylase [Monoraphidium minutum]
MAERRDAAQAPGAQAQGAQAPRPEPQPTTVGRYLACRLRDAGCSHVFAVAGDFNLALLDEFNAAPGVTMVWAGSELGAGYSADGFARAMRRAGGGVGAAVTTLGVGGLSAVNAAAGCYSEDLPVVFVNGGVNSGDLAAGGHVLHHTTGSPGVYGQQLRAYREVTCAQAVVRRASEAQKQIDYVISEALAQRKPAYLEVCCNLAGATHPSLTDPPPPLPRAAPAAAAREPSCLAAAAAAAAAALHGAGTPLLLAGPRLLPAARRGAFERLAAACGLPVAVTADAKGLLPEDHPQLVGTYWGDISAPGVGEAVAAADAVLAAGVVATDYSTLGYSAELDPARVVDVRPGSVTVMGGPTYSGTGDIADFLNALSKELQPNPAPLEALRRALPPAADAPVGAGAGGGTGGGDDAPLTVAALRREVQAALCGDSLVVADTGAPPLLGCSLLLAGGSGSAYIEARESWFTAFNLRLPPGCGLETQMRYASIGWSVGATLGMSLAAAAAGGGRVMTLVGDGAFQIAAPELSTMLRFGAAPIIVLLNNGGYVIEEEIHSGEGYNSLQPWDYAGLARAMHHGRGRLRVAVASTPGQLRAALEAAAAAPRELAFIEAKLRPDDCSAELLELGTRVAAYNARAPAG